MCDRCCAWPFGASVFFYISGTFIAFTFTPVAVVVCAEMSAFLLVLVPLSSFLSFFLCLVHHQEHIYLVFTNLPKTRTFFWKRNVSSPPTSTHATPDISRSESYSKNVSLQNSVKPMKVQKRPQAIFAWPPLTKYHEQ